MEFLTDLFWLFGKRLWFQWNDRKTGRMNVRTNYVTWSYLWRYRNDRMKVWVD